MPCRPDSSLRAVLALITGAAGGVGSALARELDARGDELVLVDRDGDGLERMAGSLGRSPVTVACDLSDTGDVASLAERMRTEWPELDVLVNNAGTVAPGYLVDVTPADIDRQLDVNLRSAMHLSLAAARLMRDRRRGSIVSVISMGGIVPLRGSTGYAASKFGLRGFNQSLHMELRPYGVKVSGILPAAIETPMLDYESRHSSGSPLNFIGKVSTPQRVVQAVLKGIETGKVEIYVPYGDSVTGRLAAAFPAAMVRLLPPLERLGERGRRRYLRRRSA
jgi:short-subunit dehydrogenase